MLAGLIIAFIWGNSLQPAVESESLSIFWANLVKTIFEFCHFHGCDPTWYGSDHTREHIPVLFFGPKIKAQALPPMETFSDLGQTLAEHLGLKLEKGKAQPIKL